MLVVWVRVVLRKTVVDLLSSINDILTTLAEVIIRVKQRVVASQVIIVVHVNWLARVAVILWAASEPKKYKLNEIKIIAMYYFCLVSYLLSNV